MSVAVAWPIDEGLELEAAVDELQHVVDIGYAGTVPAEPDTIHAPLLHVMHASIETSFPCTPSQLAFVYMFANDAASP